MATINKNRVSAENIIRCLYHSSGMANRLETFNNIQFSNLCFASSHIPAQAVDDTQASHTGSFEVVKFLSITYNMPQPTNTISKVIIHSLRVVKVIFTGASPRFFNQ